MKKIFSTIISLFLLTSCASKNMDADVMVDVKNAPYVERASVLMAIPVIIGVTELSKNEKMAMLTNYEKKLNEFTIQKIEQRKVLFTIIDKLTIKDYPKNKMKQLTSRYTYLEKNMSKARMDYLHTFIDQTQGKITKASVEKSLKKLETYFKEMDKRKSKKNY